ncbi:sensor histidine kinase [Oceanobacillus sp. CAU 1775]
MKTLYVRFTVITVTIMVLSSLVAFFITNLYYQMNLKPYNDEKITSFAVSITDFIEENPDLKLEDYLDTISSIGYQMYLIDGTGEDASFGTPYRVNNLPESTASHVLDGNMYHGILEYDSSLFVTGFFANELKNSIGIPFQHNEVDYALFLRPDIKLLFNEARYLLAGTLLFTTILSIVLIAFSMIYLVKPISKLTQATKSLSDGDFHVELATGRRDELGELSRSFLGMANQLEQMEDVRKEFISNISHDIQSPLSNIKGYTNLLGKETITKDEREHYVSVIQDETQRLSSLTKQLLLLASLDRMDDLMDKKRFNVGKQLKELIRTHQWQAGENGIMMSYSLPDIEINGDASLLNAVWDNLLTNAIKYNRPEGTIEVTLEQKGDLAVVTIKDTGVGLNEIERDRIFDRFYRADAARSRTIEGTGLGLSIVHTVVKLHSGKIKVDSQENKGSTFTIELPIR